MTPEGTKYNKKKRRGRLNRVDKVLENVVRYKGMGSMVRMWSLIKVWNEVVGETLAGRTEPLRIADDCLIVKVADSSWAHELTYLKDDLIERIGMQIEGRPIKDIRFVIGSLQGPRQVQRGPVDLSHVDVDEKEIAATLDSKALKGKPKLRKLFKKLITNTHRIRNYLNERSSGSS